MTEEDAKTKWCPHVRVQFYRRDDGSNPAVNRPEGHVNCIAGGCMSWRWIHSPFDVAISKERAERDEALIIPAATGYCGLAGTP